MEAKAKQTADQIAEIYTKDVIPDELRQRAKRNLKASIESYASNRAEKDLPSDREIEFAKSNYDMESNVQDLSGVEPSYHFEAGIHYLKNWIKHNR